MPQSEYKCKLAKARQQKVLTLIESLPVMPTAIHVPAKVMQLYRGPAPAPLSAFADVLVADAALSAKVLELANSAFFCPPKPITKVSEALKRIGLSNLLPLVFGLSLAGLFNKADLAADERTAMWQTALLKGLLAREWARWREIDQQEEAFLCGVLQDIALPAMIAADRSASPELIGIIDMGNDVRAEREAMLYVSDHSGFAERICRMLKLPELYIQATATHHAQRGPVLPEANLAIVPGLRLAATLPHALTRLDEHGARHLAECFEQVSGSKDPTEFVEFIRRTRESGKAMMSVLCPVNKSQSGMKGFLQDVADQIARTMFAAVGTSSKTIDDLQASQLELERQIKELTEQIIRADYDPLTNLLNRHGFMERADKLIALAHKLKMGCAVGFIDLVDFKALNHTHGTEAGDRALVACAKALQQMTQNRGMVGRCGHDDFGFVLVVPPDQSQETIRVEVERALAQLTITVGDSSILIGSQIGIRWLGIPTAGQSTRIAIDAAEEQITALQLAA